MTQQKELKRINQSYKDEEEWQNLRKEHVTSTGISAVLGLSPYKTPYEYWHEKKNKIKSELSKQNLSRAKVGQKLEEAIGEIIAEELELTIEPFKTFMSIPELKAGSSFDFKITKNPERPDQTGILEIKNVDYFRFKDTWVFDDDGNLTEATPYIECQAQYQLFVSGLDYIIIGVFVGGNQTKFLTREPDKEVFVVFEQELLNFNKTLADNTPPEPDWNEDADFIIGRLNKIHPDLVIDAPNDVELEKAGADYLEASAISKAEAKRMKAAKAFILDKMQDAQVLNSSFYKVKTSMVKETQISYTRKPYRTFSLTQKKLKMRDFIKSKLQR